MIEKIAEIFKERAAGTIGKYRKFAVMILLEEINEETHLIFEVRAHSLRHQPGDICLPGGKVEEGENPRETAVRETLEELNLSPEDIDYIGEMDYFISPYGTIMYPFVTKLRTHEINPNSDEVDHIFRVPLSYFLNSEPVMYTMEIGPNLRDDFPYHLVRGGKDYKFSRGTINQYFYEYDKYVIWGFTAMIVRCFAEIIKKEAKL